MTVDQIAEWYVEIIEPAIKLGAFFILVIVVLHFINIMKDGGRSSGFVGTAFNKLAKAGSSLFRYMGVGLAISARGLLKFGNVILTTMRDFFTSKI